MVKNINVTCMEIVHTRECACTHTLL